MININHLSFTLRFYTEERFFLRVHLIQALLWHKHLSSSSRSSNQLPHAYRPGRQARLRGESPVNEREREKRVEHQVLLTDLSGKCRASVMRKYFSTAHVAGIVVSALDRHWLPNDHSLIFSDLQCNRQGFLSENLYFIDALLTWELFFKGSARDNIHKE